MDLIKIMRRKTSEKQLGLNANKAIPDVTALYERLSRDDDREGESNSIINQKALLENYAEEHGFTNICHYTDDGYTGGDFDRPGWQQLIRDIEAGIVQTVIAKDMSRIGRNHIDTGFYTEIFFPRMDVRFIAVNNNVDSDNPESMEYTGFMNILNEWYLRDTSRKVRSAKQMKGRSGKPLTANPCFGYVKDPQDKDHWLVDPEAAETVRRIFELAADGKSSPEICRTMVAEQRCTPGYYRLQNDPEGVGRQYKGLEPFHWSTTGVEKILERREYLGETVNFKTTCPEYHAKQKDNPPEKWMIFPGTHEAIIDPDTWKRAQRTHRSITVTPHGTIRHALQDRVYCSLCGQPMFYHRYLKDPKSSGFVCRTYRNAMKYGSVNCQSNDIAESIIMRIIRDAIRTICRSTALNEQALRQLLQRTKQLNRTDEQKELTKRVRKAERRVAELDHLLKKLYEDYALGHVSEERFDKLSAGYEAEQAAQKEALTTDKERLSQLQSDTERVDRFIALARQYCDCTEVTDEMIRTFIDKVIVYRTEKGENGHRTRRIDIHFSFIGRIDLTGSTPNADEQNSA